MSPMIVGAFKHNHEKLNGFTVKRAEANIPDWEVTADIAPGVWSIELLGQIRCSCCLRSPDWERFPRFSRRASSIQFLLAHSILRQVPSSRSAFTRLTQDGTCRSI